MLPDFLVIGAMKAGTTTLYEDLRTLPNVFLAEKELGYLNDPAVTSATGLRRYSALFARARETQICGDVSATYAKLPDSAGVTDRAGEILPDGFKIMYVVRNPIDRAVSQHHHEWSNGRLPASIDDALREYPRLVDYGKYAMQLRPWLDLVGPDRTKVIRFEDYVAQRADGLRELAAFLGAGPPPAGADLESIHNASHDRRATGTSLLGRVAASGPYQRLRHHLPQGPRRLASRMLLPEAPPRPAPPGPSSVDLMIHELEPDLEGFCHLLALPSSPWDLDETRLRYEQMHQSSVSQR